MAGSLEEGIDEILIRYIKSLPYNIFTEINVESSNTQNYNPKQERLAVAKAHHHLEEYLLSYPELDLRNSKISYSHFKWKFPNGYITDIASPDGIGKFVINHPNKIIIIYAVYEFKNGNTGKKAWKQCMTYSLLALYFGMHNRKVRRGCHKNKVNLYVIGLTIGDFGRKITNGVLILPSNDYSSIIINYTRKKIYGFYVINNKCLERIMHSYRGRRSIRKILMENFPQLYLIKHERRVVAKNNCVLKYDSL